MDLFDDKCRRFDFTPNRMRDFDVLWKWFPILITNRAVTLAVLNLSFWIPRAFSFRAEYKNRFGRNGADLFMPGLKCKPLLKRPESPAVFLDLTMFTFKDFLRCLPPMRAKRMPESNLKRSFFVW